MSSLEPAAGPEPQPLLAANMPTPVADELAELEARFHRGGKRAALIAFLLCHRNRLELPAWLATYIADAISLYLSDQYVFTSPVGGAYTRPPITLEEAFGMIPGPDPTPEEPGHEEPTEETPIEEPEEETA